MLPGCVRELAVEVKGVVIKHAPKPADRVAVQEEELVQA